MSEMSDLDKEFGLDEEDGFEEDGSEEVEEVRDSQEKETLEENEEEAVKSKGDVIEEVEEKPDDNNDSLEDGEELEEIEEEAVQSEESKNNKEADNMGKNIKRSNGRQNNNRKSGRDSNRKERGRRQRRGRGSTNGKLKSKFIDQNKQYGPGPNSPRANMGKLVDYDDPQMIVTNLSYNAIEEFLFDSIQEINPVDVVWEKVDYDSLIGNIRPDSDTAIDTISKITGAAYDGREGAFTGGYEVIPVLIFDKMSVVDRVDYNENLGAISRELYQLDFNKIKGRNKRFFPRYGMVTYSDNVNGLVQAHVNIMSVIISAIGFDPQDFGRIHERDKLYLNAFQDDNRENFKVTIAKNKYMDEGLASIIQEL